MTSRSHLFHFVAVVVFVGASSCTGGGAHKPAEKIALPGGRTVETGSLANGLQFFVVHDSSSPTFALNIWYSVGSRDEEPGKTGLAHLFEHLMFKGTATRKEGVFDREMSMAGAQGLNAFTDRDHTAYIIELPSIAFEKAIELEADRMVNLVVNDQSFKTERDVVQNERRFRVENNPDGQMYQTLFDTAFTKHSYRWPVIGYQKDLDSMSAEDARQFYQTHYSPDKARVVIAGDIDYTRARQALEKFFGPLKPGIGSRARKTLAAEPVQSDFRKKVLAFPMPSEKLMLAYRSPGSGDPRSPEIEILMRLLSRGQSSRLHKALVNTGIATTVDCFGFEESDPGLIVFYAVTQTGHHADEVIRIIDREVSRLVREAPSDRELQGVKNRIRFDVYAGLTHNASLARFVGESETSGSGLKKTLINIERMAAIQPKDLPEVARSLFATTGRTLVLGRPKGASK